MKLTDQHYVDDKSASESMMSLLAAVNQKTSLLLHSAGILESYASMSYEKFVSDLRLIDMVSCFARPTDVSDTKLAVQTVTEIGIGGEYLSSDHTVLNWRENAWLFKENRWETILNSYALPHMGDSIHELLDLYLIQSMPESIATSIIDFVQNK